MELTTEQDPIEGSKLSVLGKIHIQETAKWARFISIVCFVMLGLLVLMAFGMGTIMSFFSDQMAEAGQPFPGALVTVFYLILAVVEFFPIYYLYQFSTKMRIAAKSDNGNLMDEAFGYLSKHYKFIGILMAIGLIFYAIALLIAIVTLGAL